MEVTVFRRSSDWRAEILRNPEEQLRLDSVKFSLALKLAYEGVR